MATLSRVTGKLFGGNAPLEEIGQFGSAKSGSPLNTQDVATIQALPAYANGWGSAIITSRNFPPIEEVTGVLKTLSYQNCYTLQEGVPVYDINTNYSATSIVKVVNGTNLSFYVSLQDDNLGHSLSDSDWWVKASFGERNIGEVVTSAIPLTDAGLHLLDGSLLSGSGIYATFVSYIASIYNSSLNYFTTEAEWQTEVSTYGVCGKFVYDSVNNTVRLPKYGDQIYTKNINIGNEAPVKSTLTQFGNNAGALAVPANNSNNSYYVGSQDGSGNVYVQNSIRSDFRWYTDLSAINLNAQISGYYYIVVATATKTQIQVDIDEIATDLNGKADVDLTNVNNSGKSTAVSWGRQFTSVNTVVESNLTGSTSATYDLGFTDNKVKMGHFAVYVGAQSSGGSAVILSSDCFSNDNTSSKCSCALTNNGYGNSSYVYIPFITEITVKTITAASSQVTFLGYQ